MEEFVREITLKKSLSLVLSIDSFRVRNARKLESVKQEEKAEETYSENVSFKYSLI